MAASPITSSGDRSRRRAVLAPHVRARNLAAGRLRRAELHQPEQSIDRHRRAALGARHLRQFFLRPRHRTGSNDERCALSACRNHIGAVFADRDQGRGSDGQGQAAHTARQRHARHLLLGRKGGQGECRRARRKRCARLVGKLAVGIQRRSVRIRVRASTAADRPYHVLDDYIQHKHAPGTPAAAFHDEHYLASVPRRSPTPIRHEQDRPVASADHIPAGLVRSQLGPGRAGHLPITDPYVAHHGSRFPPPLSSRRRNAHICTRLSAYRASRRCSRAPRRRPIELPPIAWAS